jgi:outer membrane receptor protein involved in Fe transport
MRLIILVAILILSSSPSLSQQPLRLVGSVQDSRGDAINGAGIVAKSPDGRAFTTATDDTGRYRIDLPASSGNYSVTATASGFKSQTKPINIDAGSGSQEVIVNWSLEVEALPEVMTVTPARVERRLDEVASSVVVLGSESVNQVAAQAIDDVLRQVPGFSNFRRSSSLVANPTTQGVSLRGVGASGASRTLVLSDGLPLNDAFGGWVYWDRVARASIDQAEVVRGGSSDLYGSDALSGVINLVSREPKLAVAAADIAYGNRNTFDFSFFTGFSLDGWFSTVSGELLSTDGYYIVRPEIAGAADEPAASDHRLLQLKVGYGWGAGSTSRTPQSVYLRGSLFDEDRKNGTRRQRNDTATESLAAGFRFETGDGSGWQGAIYGNQQRFHQTFTSVSANRQTETPARDQSVPSSDAGAFLNWSRVSWRRHLLLAGADIRGVRGSSDELVYVAARPTSTVSAGGRQLRSGFYFQDLISFTGRLQLTLVGRYDHWTDSSAYSIERNLATGVVRPTFFPERTDDAFSPRIAVLYQASESIRVRGAFYKAFRAPTLNELYRSFRVGDTLTLANEKLGAERLTGGETGISWNPVHRLATRLTGFWTETADPIANFTVSTTPALITRQRRNLGRTRSRGLEAEMNFLVSEEWQIGGGYIFSDSTVTDAPQDASLVGLWIPQIPRHQFTLQTSYSNPKIATVSLQFRASGNQFDDDQNRLPLGSFALVDLFASRRIAGPVEAFFAVQNLLDEVYTVGRTPTETIGAPRLVRGGVRLTFGK